VTLYTKLFWHFYYFALHQSKKKGERGTLTKKSNGSFGAPNYYVVSFIFCESVS